MVEKNFQQASKKNKDEEVFAHYVTEEEAVQEIPTQQSTESSKKDLRQQLREQARANIEKEMPSTLKIDKSIIFGVVGWGQGGSRIAEEFSKYGYPVCVGNTAQQDLEYINLPDNRKLFLDFALGGVGKDIDLGEEAFLENQDKIITMLEDTFGDNIDQIIVAIGGGGGTGTGAPIPLAKLVSQFGLPVTVLYTLPTYSEGSTTKYNAVKVLDRLARMVVNEEVHALIIVDNSRIEVIYPNVSTGDFWKLANFDIVNGLHIFNALSASPTKYTALDPMDFARVLSTGGCVVYGKMEVPVNMQSNRVVMPEDELATAIVNNMENSLLAEGFDLTETERVGVIITGKQEILDQIPAMSMNYAFAMLQEETKGTSIFKGIYADEMASDSLTVYAIYAGVGVPRARIDNLINQAIQEQEIVDAKAEQKKAKMNVLGTPQIRQETEQYRKITKKNTGFGRMTNRRKKSRG